jgi:membrane-associated phospholipid phosphatase
MNIPRDFEVQNRTGLVKFARVFSNVVSPPVMFAILGLVISLKTLSFWPGLGWAAVYGFLVSLAPILVVVYLLKTGRITELHMSNTSERHLPYATAVAFALLAFGIVTWFDGPEMLRCLLIFNVIELAALAIINIWWLISIHATGAVATWLILALVFGWGISLIALPFVLGVIWVRLYLKRHTPLQIIAGVALGVFSVLSLTLIGCF